VECPEFTTRVAKAKRWVREGAIVLGRLLNHCDGNDIRLAGPDSPVTPEWEEKNFWVRYIPYSDEWRIHSFAGLSIARGKKSNGRHELLRGLGADYHAAPEPPRGIREFAHGMVAACGYEYGACDIIVKEGGGFVALEVNTAPQMDGYTLEAYVRAIRRKFARS
jgi:hypothetical protein